MTGCQARARAQQCGEHVKRPGVFLCGDGDAVRQLVLERRAAAERDNLA